MRLRFGKKAEFFSQGDRKARFIESSRNQLIVFLVVMILIYIFIHTVWIR
jgi:hypothetical protein